MTAEEPEEEVLLTVNEMLLQEDKTELKLQMKHEQWLTTKLSIMAWVGSILNENAVACIIVLMWCLFGRSNRVFCIFINQSHLCDCHHVDILLFDRILPNNGGRRKIWTVARSFLKFKFSLDLKPFAIFLNYGDMYLYQPLRPTSAWIQLSK